TTAIVCAESREAAKEMVPASPNYPITVSATTDPVRSPYRCYHKVEDESESTPATHQHARKKSPAQLNREIAEALAYSTHARPDRYIIVRPTSTRWPGGLKVRVIKFGADVRQAGRTALPVGSLAVMHP